MEFSDYSTQKKERGKPLFLKGFRNLRFAALKRNGQG